MNNFWFYWAMWGFWVIVAFFFKKSTRRTQLCFLLLMIIAVSPFSIHLQAVTINLSFVVLALAGCSFLSHESFSHVLNLALASFIVMLVDVLAQIYWLYDPAILMVLPKWTFIIVVGALILSLSSHFWMRLAVALIGLSQGEILQSLVFYPYDQTIGDTDYLVTLSFLLILIVSWELVTQASFLLKMIMDRSAPRRIQK